MLHMNRVQAELLAFVRERRDDDGLMDLNTDLVASGLLDSLLLLDLILHVQTVHGVTLSAGDVSLANFHDLTTLARVIVDRTCGKAA